MGIYRDNIRNNIIKYRKLRGIKQSDLAKMLGTAPTTVSSWERGANAPDIETLIEICNILKISIKEMYGIDEISLNHNEVILVDKYRQLDSLSQEIVNYIIDAELKRQISNSVSLVARGGESEAKKAILDNSQLDEDLKKPIATEFDN